MTQQCNNCRFWLADKDSVPWDEESHALGQCRRHPPRIIDHMAQYSIGTLTFCEARDPDMMADSIAVNRSCLQPVTFCTDWCGEYAAHAPAVPL